jgi:hypothetical protein
MLIEVIVSTLMIALIVVATLTGFDVFNRATADERHHAQATLLAAQSQEYLRSDPASALTALETAAHVYTRALGGTTYTITQEAKPVGASGSATTCSVSEATTSSGSNFQITSTVAWTQLGSRQPVKQSSIITPPTGSDLEVDVGAFPAPTTVGVPGLAVTAKFTPPESAQVSVEGITNSGGCVVFTGIPATSAIVEVAERARYVTPTGLLKWPTKEVTIAPNITTHYHVTYNEGGKVLGEFAYKGVTKTWEGKPVVSDTFVVFQPNMLGTEFAVGSTKFEYEAGGEELYKPLTGTFATSAETAAGTKYSAGDLFPFLSGAVAYAGDCAKNKVEAEAPVLVEPGKTSSVKIPLSFVALNVKSGTKAKPGALETTSYPVAITNSQCAITEVPVHGTAANLRHNQVSNTEGHLTNPFQPFGKYELCLYNATAKKTYTATYTNSKPEGSTVTLYLGELSKLEREAEEAKTKKTREEAELAKREARKTKEKEEKAGWEKLEKEGKLTSAERKKLEEKQKETAKATEKTEETEKATAVAKEATEKTAAEKAEKERAEKEFVVASGVEKC